MSSHAAYSSQDQYASLYICIFRPYHGDRYLWAISVHDEALGSWRTYGVSQPGGEDQPFRLRLYGRDPHALPNYVAGGLLARIPRGWIGEAHRICRTTGIPGHFDDRYSSEMHVAHVCDNMMAEGTIDPDDYDAAMGELGQYRGRQNPGFGGEAEDETVQYVDVEDSLDGIGGHFS